MYKFSFGTGIGDMIIIRGLFDTFIKNGEKVFCSPNIKPVLDLRYENPESAKQYISFVYDFMKLIFNNPLFVITEENYPIAYNVELIKSKISFPKFIDLRDCLIDKTYEWSETDYIVLHTRVRLGLKNDEIKEDVINTARNVLDYINKNYKGKIVIMGERETDNMPGWDNLIIFSLYDIFKEQISPDKIIDLTIPKIGFIVPDLNNIRKDCLVMSKAFTNLVFGFGGDMFLAGSVGNLITYIPEKSNIEWAENDEICEYLFSSINTAGKVVRADNYNKLYQIIKEVIEND